MPPILRLALAATALLAAPPAAAATLHAVATGDLSPPLVTTPEVSRNGDFHVFRVGDDGSTVGDGIDEHTFWLHDFTGDPALPAFQPGADLTEATLRLTLTPPVSPVADRAAIFGLAEFRSPLLDAMTIGATQTVELDLLAVYTSSQILSALLGSSPTFEPRIPASGPGQLTLGYANDAIVSRAELTLTVLPEPGPLALLAAGLAGLATQRRAAARPVRGAARCSGSRATTRTNLVL